jgi:hypothetical protein
VTNNLLQLHVKARFGTMKRLMMLLVTIIAALLLLQIRVRGAEIKLVYLSPRPPAQLVQPLPAGGSAAT